MILAQTDRGGSKRDLCSRFYKLRARGWLRRYIHKGCDSEREGEADAEVEAEAEAGGERRGRVGMCK